MQQTSRQSAPKPAEADGRTEVHLSVKTVMEATAVVVVHPSIMLIHLLRTSRHHKVGFLHLLISRDLVGLLRHRK